MQRNACNNCKPNQQDNNCSEKRIGWRKWTFGVNELVKFQRIACMAHRQHKLYVIYNSDEDYADTQINKYGSKVAWDMRCPADYFALLKVGKK